MGISKPPKNRCHWSNKNSVASRPPSWGWDDALQKLEQKDARKAQLVNLRFFAGLTVAQAAQTLGISTSTAENDWTYARSWLKLEMPGGGNDGSPVGFSENPLGCGRSDLA